MAIPLMPHISSISRPPLKHHKDLINVLINNLGYPSIPGSTNINPRPCHLRMMSQSSQETASNNIPIKVYRNF